jgi:hypothetical protein
MRQPSLDALCSQYPSEPESANFSLSATGRPDLDYSHSDTERYRRRKAFFLFATF